MLTKSSIIAASNNVFADGLGQLQYKVSLVVDEVVQPSKCPVRKLPVALKDEVKDELECLVSREVLKET